MANYIYMVADTELKVAAVIDPGWEAAKIADEAKGKGWKITHILLTHTHFDHANDVPRLAELTGAKVCVHKLEAGDSGKNLVGVGEGDTIKVGELKFLVLHTPGHTPGSVCFLMDKAIFTGDTLFIDSIGRTDLEGSDPEEMFKSLKRLTTLADDIIVYPGHNYGKEPASTMGEQKKRNPYLKVKDMGDFLRH